MWLLRKFLKVTRLPKLRGLILSLTNLFLWTILIIFLANNLGFSKLAVAISGTILVLVFFLNTGLGPLVTDAVSGIFLCTDPDFCPGSRIQINRAGVDTVEGIIKQVDMRKVRIVDDQGRLHVFPNSLVDREHWLLLEKKDTVLKEKTKVVKEKARRVIAEKLKK
jgi:small-conductance mechanosensitive channel